MSKSWNSNYIKWSDDKNDRMLNFCQHQVERTAIISQQITQKNSLNFPEFIKFQLRVIPNKL